MYIAHLLAKRQRHSSLTLQFVRGYTIHCWSYSPSGYLPVEAQLHVCLISITNHELLARSQHYTTAK